MIDNLQDLLSHIHSLGCVDLIKVEGTDDETLISGLADDRSVVVQGKFLEPIPEFKGVFGMPGMSTLKVILGIDEYKKDAVITLKRNAQDDLVGMHFANAKGDFTNDYRFMVSTIVEEHLKNIKFKGANWNIEFNPSEAGLLRLKSMASTTSDEATFVMKTENNNLKFVFGDHSTNAGEFIFQHDVEGEIKRNWHWPVQHMINILSLSGDKKMYVSDDGATKIVVNSGIAEYSFILPAQSK